MPKITPCLWFDNQAEEAANFYVSVFENSRITGISRTAGDADGGEGKAILVTFQLDGRDFQALNGGPEFSFTEAISLSVDCRTQEEVDRLWSTLSEGGEEGQCGWLKDKYGLSWQIVPSALGELMNDPDPEKAQRVMQAVLGMRKLDIGALQAAYAGA